MRSRFPHGGEVLGAAPANPILAPVLSQDRGLGMSRQRDLLDLQAIQRIPGLVGYWKNDPQYLYEDSAGTTPASTGGTGPVGCWRRVGDAPVYSPITIANPGFDTDTDWSKGTGWTIAGGVATKSAGTASSLSQAVSLIPGTMYLLTFTLTATSGLLIPKFTGGAEVVASGVGVTGAYEAVLVATTGNNTLTFYGNSTFAGTLDTIALFAVSNTPALQSTTANKPLLRKTPTTNIYWADANTSTSAINVALGNLGSACTVARSSAEGVTFTENVSITAPYNIAPAFSFNSDVAIFNRALTDVEKALITRYMQRAVPLLGNNVVTNGTFDTDTAWTKGTGWSIGSGIASKSAGTASNLTQSVGVSGNAYYAKADATVTAGTIGAYPGSGTTQFGSTSATGTLAHAMKASGTGIGVRGDASFAGSVDNAAIKEIL